MITSAVAVGGPPVRRRRPHTTYRRADPGTPVFRPVGPVERPVPGVGPHRLRPGPARCDDPRTAARAAALRRRHILLGLVAVAVVVALALSGSGGGHSGLASPGPAPVGATLSPHSLYIAQPGDTLWSIAERLAPQGDPRPMMTKLSEQVGGTTLRAGERLILP